MFRGDKYSDERQLCIHIFGRSLHSEPRADLLEEERRKKQAGLRLQIHLQIDVSPKMLQHASSGLASKASFRADLNTAHFVQSGRAIAKNLG